MSRQTRRTFLKRATAAGVSGSFIIAGTKASGKVLGANERVRLGVAGIHGRGGSHINEFASMDDVDVTYLIDPDTRLYDGKSGQVQAKGGNTPTCVQDIREALEDDNLDAVSVATCNHWHSLITIWSCQAGKDVYVEKPCSHNVFEGRKCVEAAEKYGRIVQHGTQSRANAGWAKKVALIASGKYGKLLVSKAYASKPRWSIGFKEVKTPPPELDYNLWLGPAQEMPYHENLVHYNWHWNWATGNGEIGNQGVHQMDIARWAIPGGTMPNSVVSLGGRWVQTSEGHAEFTDQGQTPNQQTTVMDYDGTLLVFEVAGLCGKTVVENGTKFPAKVTNEFYLEEGAIKGDQFFPKGKDEGQPLAEVDFHIESGSNFENFIQCVKNRSPEKLHAPIQEAHLSAAGCHLGNISYRLGKQVPGTTEPQLPEAGATSWEYIKENLQAALGIDLDKSTYQLGPLLAFNPKTEKFLENEAANALLTRPYRDPFIVPENV